jgi:hypothetical protein
MHEVAIELHEQSAEIQICILGCRVSSRNLAPGRRR